MFLSITNQTLWQTLTSTWQLILIIHSPLPLFHINLSFNFNFFPLLARFQTYFVFHWRDNEDDLYTQGFKYNLMSIWSLLHGRIFCPVQCQTGSPAGQSSVWHEAAPKNWGTDHAYGPRSLQKRQEGGGGAVSQQPAGAGEGAGARQQPQHHLLSKTEEILTTVWTGLDPQANPWLSNAFYTLEFSKLTSFNMFSMRFVYWNWWFYPMRMLPVSVRWCRQHGQIVSVLQGGGKVEVYPKSVDCHTPSQNLAFLNFDIFQNKLGLRVVCLFIPKGWAKNWNMILQSRSSDYGQFFFLCHFASADLGACASNNH